MRAKLLCAAFLLVASVVDTAAAARWIHVRVDDSGPRAEKVRINFPLRSVRELLPLIEDDKFNHGRIQINDRDMNAARLRAIWAAVREAGDGEFVTVQSNDEQVRVARSGNFMIVKVDERQGRRGRHGTVDIKVPVTVVDALLSGGGEELNIAAAIDALDEHGPGDIVTVNDDESRVRIWVDNSQSGNDGEAGDLK